jgi:hypothetical protein
MNKRQNGLVLSYIMKKLIITHLLLNLYLLVLVLPAVPVLEYMINYNYIASVLCENRDKPVLTCNGKCYLMDQVKKQLQLDTDQQKPMPPKIDFEKFISLKPVFPFVQPLTHNQLLTTPVAFSDLKDHYFPASLLRPPIV